MSRRLILIYVVFLVTTIFRFRIKVTPLVLLQQVAVSIIRSKVESSHQENRRLLQSHKRRNIVQNFLRH